MDSAHFGAVEHHSPRRRLYALMMTLGWSRNSYVEFTVSADAVFWLRGDVPAYRYFEGVPRDVLHDNLTAAILDFCAVCLILFAAVLGWTQGGWKARRAKRSPAGSELRLLALAISVVSRRLLGCFGAAT